ncbi:glycosyltransferase family 2 protein [Actinomarinicola tropica]|uniref:glycosyltransferase family 2 protein n=1 Tax=Actinomarinicola tropica TaxID=2789776 RepID=UPI00189A4166|nr:glycosyltransferase [Actinomarinicola tropica]
MHRPTGAEPVRIVVAVCTYRRNEPLRRLLAAVERNAAELGDRAHVGVVVVDDNPDERARAVCDEAAHRFELGLTYRTSGQGNISVARNLALEGALPLADWVAMTDDDCEPVDTWLSEHLAAQERYGTDVVTGPCLLGGSEGAPAWLSEQPFLDDAQFRFDDGQRLDVAATNNSFIRAASLRERTDLRFDPGLGVLGGEDMVFFRTARRAGLTIAFAARAIVHGHEPPERWTYRYQLRSRYWLGNTEFVTNHTVGEAPRLRWALRGAKTILTAVVRPLARVASGRPPHVRYALATAARGAGMVAGAAGVRVAHH